MSSGAVGVGASRLGLTERPKTIALKQAAAAVGQGMIMRVYDDLFREYHQPVAQVLLTRGDLDRRLVISISTIRSRNCCGWVSFRS